MNRPKKSAIRVPVLLSLKMIQTFWYAIDDLKSGTDNPKILKRAEQLSKTIYRAEQKHLAKYK